MHDVRFTGGGRWCGLGTGGLSTKMKERSHPRRRWRGSLEVYLGSSRNVSRKLGKSASDTKTKQDQD
ncbi:hypothetical protein HYQ44_016218 [Verticillium longisporum]|nr:hypothetical protein HYQ44_016218 [Verticillium longisporum]